MSTPLKQYKEIEGKLHEGLYDNILLLIYTCPPTKEFYGVFKRDMFAKNNKAAFHQVVYYLLNTLNPQQTKEKISTWPLYDVKLEAKFRLEVLTYINELNAIYEHADIPSIVASHLISPGGFKFVKFMFKLSQLVLHEHLKTYESISAQMLGPIKPHKNSAFTNMVMKNLKEETAIIEAETRQKCENFLRSHENASLLASEIVFEQSEITKDLDKLVKVRDAKKHESQLSNEAIKESLNTQLDGIKNKSLDVEKTKTLCNKCSDLLTYLLSNECVLEFDKNASALSNNNKNVEFHLNDLFSNLMKALEQESRQMPIFTSDEINNVIRLIEEILKKYSKLNKKHTFNKNKFVDTLENFYQFVEQKSKKWSQNHSY